MLPRGVGIYTFPHRTIQEYLAACYLTNYDYPKQVAQLAREEPNRWREVALLAGAKAGRGSLYAVWALAEALYRCEVGTAGSEEADAWGGLIAGQLLLETVDLSEVNEWDQPKVEQVRHWQVNILEKGELPALERVKAGTILADLGDARTGVGLREDGLPDVIWCEVPAGPFKMGSDKDRWAKDEEQPQHEVILPTYWMSQYPVTNAQYRAFVQDGGYSDEWRRCWTEKGWAWERRFDGTKDLWRRFRSAQPSGGGGELVRSGRILPLANGETASGRGTGGRKSGEAAE